MSASPAVVRGGRPGFLLLLPLLPNSVNGYLATLSAWQTLDQGALQQVHHIKTFSVDGTMHAISLVPFFWSNLHWSQPDYNAGNVWNFWRWSNTFGKFTSYPFTPTHAECVSDYEPLELNGATYLVEVSFIPRAPSPCGQAAKLLRWNGTGWAEQSDIPPIPVNDSWRVKAMSLGGAAHLVFSPAAQHGDHMTLWRFNGKSFQLIQDIHEIRRRAYPYWSLTNIDNEVYFIVGVWPIMMRRRLNLKQEQVFDANVEKLVGESNQSGVSSLQRQLTDAAPKSAFNVIVFRFNGTALEVHQTWGNNPGCGKLQKTTCTPGCSGIIPTIIDGKHYLLEQHIVGGLWLHRWDGTRWQVYQHITAQNNAASSLFIASDDFVDPGHPQFGKGDSLTLSSRYSGGRTAENQLWRWNGTHFHESARFTAPSEKSLIPAPTWSVFKIDRRTFVVSTSGTIFTPSPITTMTRTTSTTSTTGTTVPASEATPAKRVAQLQIALACKKQSLMLVNTVAAAMVLAL